MASLLKVKSMLVGIGIFGAALAASAYAQTSVIRVDIPFPFMADGQSIPAGTYVVRIEDDLRRVMFASANDTHTHVASLTPNMAERKASAAELATLQFQKYGEHYVLSAVWRPGETGGHKLAVTKTERDLAKRYGPGEVVGVAMGLK